MKKTCVVCNTPTLDLQCYSYGPDPVCSVACTKKRYGEGLGREEKSAPSAGVKFDGEKDRWDLLPIRAVRAIVRVLTFGARKYAPDNWRKVPDARNRYFAATMRHLIAWREGAGVDKETGESHLAHAACCIMFLQELDADAVGWYRIKSPVEGMVFKYSEPRVKVPGVNATYGESDPAWAEDTLPDLPPPTPVERKPCPTCKGEGFVCNLRHPSIPGACNIPSCERGRKTCPDCDGFKYAPAPDDTPLCRTCGAEVREGLIYCAGLSTCWLEGEGVK